MPKIRKLPTKKEAQKWADALRSGKYKQTHGVLQDRDGYCCLGVACKIFIPIHKQTTYEGLLYGGLPIKQKLSPSWLKYINERQLGRMHQKFFNFSDLNDRYHYSFDEIADIIELLYVHKA